MHKLNRSKYSVQNNRNKYYTNGSDNDKFYFLEKLYEGSTTTGSVIKKYTNLIFGDGLISDDNRLDDILSKKDLRLFILDYKIYGNSTFRIEYNYKGEIAKIKHLPVKYIAINIEDDLLDDPTSYWVCVDWKQKSKYPPVEYPAYGSIYQEDETKIREIYHLKNDGSDPIFGSPDWESCSQYSELEIELSNYFISHIQGGFSPKTIININQGASDSDEAKQEVLRTIKKQLTGTDGDKLIVSINDNKENQTTVEHLNVPDIYQQFEFVSKEAQSKILMGFRVNDTGLFGLPNTSGFSSDSDKIVQSKRDLYRDVINPIREEILEPIRMFFPDSKIEFKDFEEFDETDPNETAEEDINMMDISDDVDSEKIDQFIDECGESIDLEKWELVEDMDKEYQVIDIDMADTGTARPNSRSSQDFEDVYKIRYRYTGSESPQREFCRKMMSANKIYRKEDIEQMTLSNPQFAPKGSVSYSVWLFKGGVNCEHQFSREIYVNKDRTKGVDPNNPNAEIVSATTMIKESGYVPELNDPRVYIKPNNMPNGARLN
jgi:hypothetical protein